MELYESVYQRENLNRAFLKVKKNKGCFGVDRISIDTFERKLDPNLREIQRLLKIDKYRPMPVERVYIPKSNGKKRPLGIPVVRDRVLQQAVVNIIEPKFEKIFSNCSFGFRAKKSPLQAIDEVQRLLKEGHDYVVEADIKDFFGTLHQQRLIYKVKEQAKDTKLIGLVWKFLKAGIMEEGRVKRTTSGTP